MGLLIFYTSNKLHTSKYIDERDLGQRSYGMKEATYVVVEVDEYSVLLADIYIFLKVS